MTFLFYIFAALALVGGIGVVVNKIPVSSAFAMIVSFLGLAALFIQLDAYLVGILQILVYAGSIMVLFLFIIMLLDVEVEEKRAHPFIASLGAAGIAGGITLLVITVLKRSAIGDASFPKLSPVEGSGNTDVHRIGELLFSQYWFPVLIVAVLLLVATVGAVVLSKKQLR